MKKGKYYLIGVALMAVALMNLNGCMNPALQKKQAEKALEEKYGEAFQITNYNGVAFGDDYYTVDAYAEAHPEIPFLASIDLKNGVVSDPYVTKRLCGRISDKVIENIAAIKDDIYVFTEAALDGTLLTDPEISFEAYIQEMPETKFYIHIFIDHQASTKKELVNELLKTADGFPQLNGSLCLYFGTEEQLNNIREYAESHNELYREFQTMTDDMYIGTYKIVNGNVLLTEYELMEKAGDRL